MMVRITLNDVDDEYGRIRFDLSIDAQNRPMKDMVWFGFEGSLNDLENSHPVMLNQSGTIDLGDAYDVHCRYHKTNLLEKEIKVKSYVTIWWKYETEKTEVVYFIEAITLLT
jgi:hypothetical protein